MATGFRNSERSVSRSVTSTDSAPVDGTTSGTGYISLVGQNTAYILITGAVVTSYTYKVFIYNDGADEWVEDTTLEFTGGSNEEHISAALEVGPIQYMFVQVSAFTGTSLNLAVNSSSY